MQYLKKSRLASLPFAMIVAAVLIVVTVGVFVVSNREPAADTDDQQPAPISEIDQEQPAEPAEPIDNPAQNSEWPVQLTNAQASSLTVVVNKKHKLPVDYAPELKSINGDLLRPEAADALKLLLDDAKALGMNLSILSAYRSYATQQAVYNGYVEEDGQADADTYSARPGHSEHQTGLAVDLGNGTCDLEECFGDTGPGQWLASNAFEYGFIVRYEKGKQRLTGYQYEPWHLRYVGKDIARAIKVSGKTMDQFYDVPAGDYN